MFTPEEIAKIERLLSENLTPEQIADKELGLPRSTFRTKLSNSGYRIAIRRSLERIVAVAPAADTKTVPISTAA